MRKATTMLLAAAVVLACGAVGPQDAYVPVEGYVPTADVAIKIAVAVWEPIYGARRSPRRSPTRRHSLRESGPSRVPSRSATRREALPWPRSRRGTGEFSALPTASDRTARSAGP